MPYSATVIINDISYGTGYASSKKLAKLEAGMSIFIIFINFIISVIKPSQTAKVTLKILIPEIYKGGDGEKNNNKAPTDYDVCIYLSIYPFIYLSIYLSIFLSIYLSVYPFIYLPLHTSSLMKSR